MELGVTQTRLGDAIQRGRRDDAAESARNAVALVVRHDEEDVGCALWRHDAGRPVGLGIQGTFFNHATERRRRRRKLFAIDCHGGIGRTGRAGDLLGLR